MAIKEQQMKINLREMDDNIAKKTGKKNMGYDE
jgi:hypothetical protein